LNRELSEDAEANLQSMHESAGGGEQPPSGMHGLRGLFGSGKDQTKQARELFLGPPTSLVVRLDGDRIEMTNGDGRVRALTANGRKEKVDGRDVRTKWDSGRIERENVMISQTSSE
jgi:hypothetical protein